VLLAMGIHSHERQAGIIRYAREGGWLVDARLLSFHAVGQDQQYLSSTHYDGVLAMLSLAATWLVPLVKKLNVPVVDMWADYPQEPYPRVLLDHGAAGRLGAEHLLERGFRNLLFYTHAIEGKASVLRREAFQQTALERSAAFYELKWDHTSPPSGVKGRIDWLARCLTNAPLPLGVMGVNDHVASEVLDAAALANLQIPGQIAVLGVDNDPLVTELARVPLSSIDSARERAGYEAAALLERLMRGEPAPAEPIRIPPGRVVIRRSTDVLAVQDPHVAQALQFIQDHFAESINVDDVASSSLISRRELQDRFLSNTSRTISQTLLWRRINQAKTLLAETRGKVQAIAFQSGFKTGEHLSRVFRRATGMTPQQFRERYRSTGATR
jgi:LacI family transcriptional regulator